MKELEKYREKIDEIDSQLIKLLADRFKVTHQVGLIKAKLDLSAIDKERELIQFEKIERLAIEFGLNSEFAKKVLRLIIDKVVEDHRRIAQDTK